MVAQRRMAMKQGVSGEAECFGRAIVDLAGAAHNTLPPLISLSGQSPSREAKAEGLRNLETSGPTSVSTVW
jgi:hypothetical protein